MDNKLKGLFLWTVTGRPYVYASLYLALIPAYALVFTYIRGMSLEHSKTTESIWSNLYYSVVTITTLGYGDILPKNVQTQTVVATEVLFGVLLVGLFLNSIAQHISQKISLEEKQIQEDERVKFEALKLHNLNKIIEINITYYLMYIVQISTPISKRCDQKKVNEDFTLNDMQDLYRPSMRLTDNFFQPAVFYYFDHQTNLVNSLKELIYHVDLRQWPELEEVCLSIINRCKQLDFSEYIKSQVNVSYEGKKATDFCAEMLKEHTGEVKFLPSNSINPYVALYWLVKGNLVDVKKYRNLVALILGKHLAQFEKAP